MMQTSCIIERLRVAFLAGNAVSSGKPTHSCEEVVVAAIP